MAQRFYDLDRLIYEQQTGNINELADKLKLSRRQTYKYLNALERISRHTKYDSQKNSYVYLS